MHDTDVGWVRYYYPGPMWIVDLYLDPTLSWTDLVADLVSTCDIHQVSDQFFRHVLMPCMQSKLGSGLLSGIP